MILAALLLQTVAPPTVDVATLRNDCAAGIGGDASAADRCSSAVRSAADALSGDQAVSTCMSVPKASEQELTWAVVDGLAGADPRGDAATAATAALLAAYPCGVRRVL